jgi:hypothetical protein
MAWHLVVRQTGPVVCRTTYVESPTGGLRCPDTSDQSGGMLDHLCKELYRSDSYGIVHQTTGVQELLQDSVVDFNS